mgnify:CR=1 FL=1
MNFCENVTTCTADECTDFLCFDYTTGILTANPPEEWWVNLFVIGGSYCVIRFFQLWLGSLYWQKERELLSVNKEGREKSEIKKQMMIQFARSILSTLGFYLLIQQSLYMFIALIFLDTYFVKIRLKRLLHKDHTHVVQDTLVELSHLYDSVHDKMEDDTITSKMDQLIALMRKQNNNEDDNLQEVFAEVAPIKRRPYLSF